MATQAFISGYTLKRSNSASPDVFTDVPEVIEISGFGQTNEQREATHFGSDGVREYIPGLADGSEYSVTCNRLPDNAVQTNMINDVGNKATTAYQMVETDGRGNTETFQWAAVALGWTVGPSVDDRATIVFSFKITGDITKS
jgi:hypothetical protein